MLDTRADDAIALQVWRYWYIYNKVLPPIPVIHRQLLLQVKVCQEKILPSNQKMSRSPFRSHKLKQDGNSISLALSH